MSIWRRFSKQKNLHDLPVGKKSPMRDCAKLSNGPAEGVIDADLTGGLIKQRVARLGQGRSGGYRTLMAFRLKYRIVFLYGFAKSERDNIDSEEREYWRQIARSFLQMEDAMLGAMIDQQELKEVNCYDKI